MSDSSVEPPADKTTPTPTGGSSDKLTSIVEDVKALPGRIFKKEAYFSLLLLLVGAVAAVVGTAQAQEWVGGVVTKKAEPLITESEKRTKLAAEKAAAEQRAALDATEARLNAKIDEVKQQAAMKEERDGRRFEMIVQTVVTGKYQPGTAALTRPPDGGP